MISINRDTGKLATIFSPPEPVEQRAFISVPPEAAIWAERAGLETPPDLYDILPAQYTASMNARISSPKMFSILRGRVRITGSAIGEDLSFYRLQYGQGLNPSQWYPIGDDSQKSIEEGVLATWDTSDLDGLYALQLLLVHRDQNAERSTILVTVDNISPSVKIVNPTPQENIQLNTRPSIVLQAELNDNLGIASADFWIDGRLFATLTQPPYAISWDSSAGDHTLRVTAADEAGNTAEDQVVFTVE
jgi:hypothetical protein